jgi:twitching motility protein PilT
MSTSLQQYRLRKTAVRMRRFTAEDLASASKSGLTTVQKFVNRLDQVAGILNKENVSTGEPGRPVVLYSLTNVGVRRLATEIAPIAKELNEHLLQEAAPARTTAVPRTRSIHPLLGTGLGQWIPAFANNLEMATRAGAALVFFEGGQPAMLRVENEIQRSPGDIWTVEKIMSALGDSLNEWQVEQYRSRGWTAGAPAFFNEARWGIRVKRVGGNPTVELKRMPANVPTIEDLYLPPLVGELLKRNTGVVLITGIGRSGRSRAMAAMVDRVNRTRTNRIVTLEDPILYVHERQQSIVEQRQVALDVPDILSGLDQALEDSAEVLAVSELADKEMVERALAAADHSLIVARVTAADPASALRRMVGFFPSEEQEHIRTKLMSNLTGVVALAGLEPQRGQDPVAAASVVLVDGSIRASLIEDPQFERFNARFEMDTPTTHSLATTVGELRQHDQISESTAAKYLWRVRAANDYLVAHAEPKQAAKS